MQVLAFPGCCTAKVLVGFGQESNAGYSAANATTSNQTLAEMKAEIHGLLTGSQIGHYMGVVTAALTSRQTRGIQALTEMGFSSSGAKKKVQHRESDLLLFFINPAEYLKSDIGKALGAAQDEIRRNAEAEAAAIRARQRAAGVANHEDRRLQMINATTAHLAEKIRAYKVANPFKTDRECASHIKALARRRWEYNFAGQMIPHSLRG